jgi:predicted phage terminase large subunit-like protein
MLNALRPQAATGIDPELERELARSSFRHYVSYVHGDFLEEVFGIRHFCEHLDAWAEQLMQPEDTVIISPPETFKSSLFRWWMEYLIGCDVDTTIVYVMNTSAQSERQVAAIEHTIEANPLYKAVFPDVVPDKDRGWSHEQAFVQRPSNNPNPTLYATGWKGGYQGLHPDYLLLDDLTNQTDVDSRSIMEDQRSLLKGVLIDRRKKGGFIKTIMTRWGEADLLTTFQELRFQVTDQPVEGRYRWGRLLCPELYPDSRLQDLKETKGALYWLTYMCNPAAATGSDIPREWWRFYEPSQPPVFKYTIHSWDLSTGRKDGDYSAFGSWGVADNGYYMTNGGHWRLTPEGRKQKMVMLYEAERPQYVLVEDSSVSMDFIDTLKRETRLPLKLEKPGNKDKTARLKGQSSKIETGRVWLPSKQPWVSDFIDECSRFPGGEHDDQVDQMTQALKFMSTSSTGTLTVGGKIRKI